MLVASECPFLTLHLTSELTVADRRQKREIRQLEQELHKWQVLVDSITGEAGTPESILCGICPIKPLFLPYLGMLFACPVPVFPTLVQGWEFPTCLPCSSSGMSSPDFDNQTLAVLRGRMVRYLMRSREVGQAVTVPTLPGHPSLLSLPLPSPCFLIVPWPVWGSFPSFPVPALTFTIFPDHPGQSNQGQPDRCGPVSRRSSLEDLPQARYNLLPLQRPLTELSSHGPCASRALLGQ